MKTIFVVDDSAQLIDVFEILLKETYMVFSFCDGARAKEILSQCLPSLVITDIEMPVMGGVELTAWIKANHPEIPVILMSGGNEPANHQANKFIEKPPNWALLLKIISELLSE